MPVPKQAIKKLSASKKSETFSSPRGGGGGAWRLFRCCWWVAVAACFLAMMTMTTRMRVSIFASHHVAAGERNEVAAGEQKAKEKDEPVLVKKDMSRHATVMGMASGYGLDIYQQFVGSLRNTGYSGHIILGIAPDAPQLVLDYLAARSVTVKVMKWVNCTYANPSNQKDIFQQTTCAHPYPDIKLRWSRFPLARDWLEECPDCTGPVLLTDVRDVYFQDNPFGPSSPEVRGLQVFQEHDNQTTLHWLVSYYVQACKNVRFDRPMLCSGTTVGTRSAMMQYLAVMYDEMKVWIQDEKCRFDRNGDDQTIHNYLFYATDKLSAIPATPIPHRRGIVNTVGVEGAVLWNQHLKQGLAQNMSRNIIQGTPYEGGAQENSWIGSQFGLTDKEGFLTNLDGTRSRVIHQFDRLGFPFRRLWMAHQTLLQDPYP